MTTPYPDRPRQRRQADSMQNTTIGSGSGLMEDTTIVQPLSYLDRPVQFVVMRIGNVSTNTAPRLQLPPLPLVVIEDTVLSIQLEYTDNELDIVDFRLESVSLIGNVSLSASGQLTYVPCRHCTGMDMISLSIRERPIVENHTPLEDSGEIILQIRNVINDPPLLYFYDNDNMDEIIANTTITVYIDSNRTIPAALASVAAMDFDGYSDDLQLAVLQDGRYGRVGFQTILDAVGILESLPVSVPEGLNQRLSSYLDYLTFLSSYVTYLPNDPSFTGQDTISIIVRDSVLLQNLDLPLVINIEVLPSVCENNGVCSGSVADPNCTDIASRRVNSSAYNCSCLPGFEGRFCEIILIVPQPVLTRGMWRLTLTPLIPMFVPSFYSLTKFISFTFKAYFSFRVTNTQILLLCTLICIPHSLLPRPLLPHPLYTPPPYPTLIYPTPYYPTLIYPTPYYPTLITPPLIYPTLITPPLIYLIPYIPTPSLIYPHPLLLHPLLPHSLLPHPLYIPPLCTPLMYPTHYVLPSY